MQNQLNQFINSYPELLEKKVFRTLPVKTLEDLGLRRSEQAVKTHLKYKASSRVAHFTVPGLWLAISDLPLVEKKTRELQALRDAIQQKYLIAEKTKSTILQERKAADIRLLRTALASLSGLGEAEIAIDLAAMFAESVPGTDLAVAKTVAALLLNFKTELTACVIGGANRIGHDPYQQCFITAATPFAVEYFLPLKRKEFIRPVLLNDEAGFLLERTRHLAFVHKELIRIFNHWDCSRPVWFPAKSLAQWSIAAVADPECSLSKHPLLSLPSVSALSTGVAVKWHANKVTVTENPLSVVDALWSKKTLPPNKLSSVIEQHLHDKILQQLREWLPSFEGVNLFNVESARMEYTPETWRDLLRQCLQSAATDSLTQRKWFACAQFKLSVFLQQRREALAVQRCKNDLPPSIIDMFPLARRLNRRFTFIHGPTNSGKTYEALKILKEAKSGVYLGPLRLLALEIFDAMNLDGVPTNLLTGELSQNIPGAQHTSSTIEMLNFKDMVDVAIIDEVQMLSCRSLKPVQNYSFLTKLAYRGTSGKSRGFTPRRASESPGSRTEA